MATRRVQRSKSSSFRLRVTQRLRRSWTRSRLRRTERQLLRANQRLLLLQLELDSQHLRVKELTSLSQALTHREQETLESRQFLLEQGLGQLTPFNPAPQVEVLTAEQLNQLLGR